MDDIQDVSVHTVGEKVDLLAPGWVGGRPTSPAPLHFATGLFFEGIVFQRITMPPKFFFLV